MNADSHPELKKSPLTRLTLRLAQARFFSVSMLIHAVLVLLGGSVVLIQQAASRPDFESGSRELVAEELTQATLPEEPASALTPEFAPSAAVPPVADLTAITSTTIAPVFVVASLLPSTENLQISPDASKLAAALGKSFNSGPSGGVPGGSHSFFGQKEKLTSGLIGSFYDLKQDRSHQPTQITNAEYHDVWRKFVREGWKESVLKNFYKAPNPLYTSQIFIPNMPASEGPKAFGVEKEVQPSRWLAHYQGRVAAPQSGTFHFVGGGDDVLVVRLNGKVVLEHGWAANPDWAAEKYYDYGFTSIRHGFARGPGIRIEAGKYNDLEILIGEQPGGYAFFCLLLEEEGVEYRKDAKGNPILPAFRLAEGPLPELEKGQKYPPYEPVGPVWKAIATTERGGDSFAEAFH